MSLSQTILYDSIGSFVADANVTISGNKAKLALIPNPAPTTFAQHFASASGFTYDSDKAEFVGGAVRQKQRKLPGATFFAAFTSGLNGAWGDGTLTGTAIGSPTVSAGLLHADSTTPKAVKWDATDNVGSATVGAVRFKFIPQFTGAPGSPRVLFVMRKSTSDTASSMHIYIDASGNIVADIYSETASLVAHTSAALAVVSGTVYEIELNYDIVGGHTRLFVDGVLHGSDTGTGTRDLSEINDIVLGCNYSELSGIGSNSNFDWLLLFNAVQHTTDYTPDVTLPPEDATHVYEGSTVALPSMPYTGVGTILTVDSTSIAEAGSPHYVVGGKYWNGSAWVTSNFSYGQSNTSDEVFDNLEDFVATGATSIVVHIVFGPSNLVQSSVDDLEVVVTGQVYPTDDPGLTNASGVDTDELTSFAAVQSAVGSDGIRFMISVMGTLKYWNGSAWVTSNGTYAQANTAADIHANASALSLTGGMLVKVRALLHSADGLTTPDLTSVTLGYDFAAPDPTPPDECVVYGFVKDLLGDDNGAGAAILIVTNTTYFIHSGQIIRPSVKRIETDADGYFEASFVETTSVSKNLTFKVEYVDDFGESKTFTLGEAKIPHQTSVNVTALSFT